MALQQVAGKKEIRDILFNIMNKLAEEKSVLSEDLQAVIGDLSVLKSITVKITKAENESGKVSLSRVSDDDQLGPQNEKLDERNSDEIRQLKMEIGSLTLELQLERDRKMNLDK